MTTGIPVDLELKKAFQELQVKAIQTSQQIKVSDAQVETLKRHMIHSNLVLHEIDALPDDTNTYEGVGRMFILQPIPVIKKNIEEKVKTAKNKIKSIETTKGYLENSMKESENSLREMVTSRKLGASLLPLVD